MAADITHIVAGAETRHRNLSMCVEIASLGINADLVVNMVTALKLVRRTPWGRAEGHADIKSAITQSGILTRVLGSWRPQGTCRPR
jgi:hypothetical protein